VRAALDAWVPALLEIGRSGPYLLNSNPQAGAKVVGTGGSPLPDELRSIRTNWRRWLVPLAAVAVIAGSAMTYYGRLAIGQAVSATLVAGRQLRRLPRRRKRSTALRRLRKRITRDLASWLLMAGAVFFLVVAARIPWIAERPNEEPFFIAEGISSWPATWLRALAVFLAGCYFWIIAWQFRAALARATREFVLIVPGGCPEPISATRPTPCTAWDRFRIRSRGTWLKAVVLIGWVAYIVIAMSLFRKLDPPALVTRGVDSMWWERIVLMCAVFAMHLLISYAVVHNVSCALFIRQVAKWLRRPDRPDQLREQRLHTAAMRAIGQVGGAMTHMIYYPFVLLFLLIAARHGLFDDFDWPTGLITVFTISCVVLLASTLLVRRSADNARKNAVIWLEEQIAAIKWKLAGVAEKDRPEDQRRELARTEWQLAQVQEVSGAALRGGFFANPLLRAVLIPIGGSGVLQLIDAASGFF
jgi:hypothetical protein